VRASSYVGRVGGLAIAIGFASGAAILGAGDAWASPGQGVGSSAESVGNGAEPGSGTGRSSGRVGKERGNTESGRVTASQRAGVADDLPSRSGRSRAVAAPAAAGAVDVQLSPEAVVAPAPRAAQAFVSPRVADVQRASLSAVTADVPAAADAAGLLSTAPDAAGPLSVAPEAAGPAVGGSAAVQTQHAASGALLEGALGSLLRPGRGVVDGSGVSWVVAAAARRELSGLRPATRPASAVSTGEPLDSPAAAAVANAEPSADVSETSAITPKDEIDILFSGLNSTIGWIPFVGTAINAVKFAIDTIGLVGAVIDLNFPQVLSEVGNLVADTIGLVPVVGAPVSSLLSQTVLGVNEKLGIVVQESFQEFIRTNDPYSKYPLTVEAVDVGIGFFGAHSGTATVSKTGGTTGPVIMDITNSGFESGWSVPLEGRLQLFAISVS